MIVILETFVKVKELSRIISSILCKQAMKYNKKFVKKSGKTLEEIIDIEPEVIEESEDEEI